jgi:hypothetical protein
LRLPCRGCTSLAKPLENHRRARTRSPRRNRHQGEGIGPSGRKNRDTMAWHNSHI